MQQQVSQKQPPKSIPAFEFTRISPNSRENNYRNYSSNDNQYDAMMMMSDETEDTLKVFRVQPNVDGSVQFVVDFESTDGRSGQQPWTYHESVGTHIQEGDDTSHVISCPQMCCCWCC